MIDDDDIMALISRYTNQTQRKRRICRAQRIGLIQFDAKFIEETDNITEYLRTLQAGKTLNEKTIHTGVERFKMDKHARDLADIAAKYTLESTILQMFIAVTLRRIAMRGAYQDGSNLGEKFRSTTQKVRPKAENSRIKCV